MGKRARTGQDRQECGNCDPVTMLTTHDSGIDGGRNVKWVPAVPNGTNSTEGAVLRGINADRSITFRECILEMIVSTPAPTCLAGISPVNPRLGSSVRLRYMEAAVLHLVSHRANVLVAAERRISELIYNNSLGIASPKNPRLIGKSKCLWYPRTLELCSPDQGTQVWEPLRRRRQAPRRPR